jgi:type III secretion protein Q
MIEGDQITLAQELERQGGNWLMSEDGEESGGDGDIDDLPVRLAFDVGRLDIPLGQMKQLAAGAVLELGRAATGVVTISANGNRIGRGELVDVDGSLGVRIINLFSHDE